MPLAVQRPRDWNTARGRISLDPPLIVGILNVTPDSFSDGGRFVTLEAAVRHAGELVTAGAGMLDVGAESTRPGAARVSDDEEWRRLAPVLDGLAREMPAVPVSVDTTRSRTAARALDAGAWVINDVSGLRLDAAIADECARRGAGLVLMHSRGSVAEMATYDLAQYADVTADVARELEGSIDRALRRGVARGRLVLDPGLGFAKTPEQSLTVLRGLADLARFGLPIMIGPSRKRFLGAVTGRDVAERDAATAAACAMGYLFGASIFRVHAVAPTRDALAMAHALSAN
ncbi:MAG: dihydropteroate synthase [Gemmatimonadetes bacterium]|nr:dihydropteroate synthase [Gemmatimonadota bacterium]